jgi:hypothetical protein
MDTGVTGATPQPLRDVVGAVRLHNGTVAVADASAREVRYYGSDGRFLFTALDSSGAPPTFTVLGSLTRHSGDSLLAFDPDAERVFVLGSDGVVARRTQLEWDRNLGLDRAATFSDGSFAVRSAWRPSDVPTSAAVGRAPLWFLRFAPDGRLLDTIAVATGPAVASVALGSARTFVSPLLGPVTVHAVHGDALYVGTGERFEVRVHALDGALRRLLRVPGADLSVTLEELDAARVQRASTGRGNPLAERLMAQAERSIPPPSSRPAYGDLHVDVLGNVWVGEYPWLGPGGAPPRTPRIWTVFDPQGGMLGEIEVPDGLQILEIGRDHLLALRWELSGAQNVVMYGLVR